MIVLDTNQLRQVGFPGGALMPLLRKAAERLGHELALPEMVVVEHLAHHRRAVENDLGKALKLLQGLGNTFDVDLAKELRALTPDRAVEKRGFDLRTSFRVLPAPTGGAAEALSREANRRPPAEQQWEGSDGKAVKARGARDVLIWLTVLEAAASEAGPVWFVTEDGDFRDGKEDFHPALREEADQRLGQDSSTQLRVLRMVDLLKELGTSKNLPSQAVQVLLESTTVRDEVAACIAGPTMFFQLGEDAYVPGAGPNFLMSNAGDLTYNGVQGKPEAYDVDGSTWVSVKTNWSGRKSYNSITTSGDGSAASAWTTVVRYEFLATVLIKAEGDPLSVRDIEILSVGPLMTVGSSASSRVLTP